MPRTIFITGTSSGLGKLTALHFARQGWNVIATMRQPNKDTELRQLPNVKVLRHDVVNVEQTQQAVSDALSAFGQVDVVINNAGLGTYGALELADEASIDWQFAVNVRGPINVIRAFLPHFRSRRQGMFINISSFMGVTTAVPVGSLYNMSKFALEGLTEGLYYELKPLGISLHLIEQGGSTGTEFARNIIWHQNPDISDYDAITAKVRDIINNPHSPGRDDPQLIVDAIDALAQGRSSQFRTVVGESGQKLVALRQSIPIEEYLETIAANWR